MQRHWDEVLKLIQKAEPFVEVILVDARGSIPSDTGARILVNHQGLVSGTVGGGKVEAKAIEFSKKLLADSTDRKNDFVVWNLQKDVGMTCGGEVKLFFQRHNSPVWKIAVFGAGHVAQGLVPLLCQLDCQVYCVDPRREWLDQLKEHSRLKKIHSEHPYQMVKELPLETFFVLMTQGHSTDFPILREILTSRSAPYVGVIGSRSKALVLKKELKEAGVEESLRNSFLCPVGLPIGNNSTAEIAISIAAQLLSVRDNKGVAINPNVANHEKITE